LLSVAALLVTSYYLTAQLGTIYADRVVPLEDLQRIDRLLTITLPADPAAAPTHWASVQKTWQKYLATYLTPEEAKLAHSVGLQLQHLQTLATGPSSLDRTDYARASATLTVELDALRELQGRVAKATLEQAQQAGRLAAGGGVILAAVSVVLILVMARIMTDHIVRPLRSIAQQLAALAQGETGSPPVRQQLSGDFGEVGDQLRSLRSFLAERMRLLDAEQAHVLMLQATQAELIEAEKLASLGRLVAGAAHELGTPLGIAVAVSSSLAERSQRFAAELAAGPLRRSMLSSLLSDVDEATELLTRNLARAAEMLRSFKQVAVDRNGMLRRHFDLAGLIDELLVSLRPVHSRGGAQLVNAVPPGINMESYPGALGQALGNLVANAVIHGLQGGVGEVRLELQAAPDAAHIVLGVCDTGCGMPPAVQARVFEPFFTTRLGQGGSGLGLPIVRNLVVGVLGGRIGVSSVPGAGSRFVLHLPLVAPIASEPVDPNPETTHAARLGHV
jgi:signal transduction histidine kinase